MKIYIELDHLSTYKQWIYTKKMIKSNKWVGACACFNIFTQILKTFELTFEFTLISVNELDVKNDEVYGKAWKRRKIHARLVVKLFAYGFDDKTLRFIYNYLRHHKQRTRIGDSYSSWQEILYGVPQGSILGPLLFNADLCDLFITTSRYDIVYYADDNTSYVSVRNIEEV